MTETLQCICVVCNRSTFHSVIHSLDEKTGSPEYDAHYQLIECRGCGTKSFRYSDRSPLNGFLPDGSGFIEREHLFPPRHLTRKPIDLNWLPIEVRRIYGEVHRALRSELRTLAAIGIRATIETLCNQKKIAAGNLFNRIEALQKEGFITAEQKNGLHAERLMGNDAAHEIAEPSDDELEGAMDVLDAILETVYILPKRTARMKLRARQRKNNNDNV